MVSTPKLNMTARLHTNLVDTRCSLSWGVADVPPDVYEAMRELVAGREVVLNTDNTLLDCLYIF